ncbi:hypothetical protein ElyMa_000935600 [Elysia marginata]|uniref:Uncharacterized protein n=1 Tax=Elysia marginata TaxID=1093978 RepID=A0AAV4HE46_9GAST|nr:hypothetical protein ElyMa_000935600 [Elysia marginata]
MWSEYVVLLSSQSQLSSSPMHIWKSGQQGAHSCSWFNKKEYRRTILHAVDREVFVLAVLTFVYIEDASIWVAFGICKHLRRVGSITACTASFVYSSPSGYLCGYSCASSINVTASLHQTTRHGS